MIKDIIKGLKPSATLFINEQTEALESKGKKIYKFGFGQSPFPVPTDVVEELKKNAHQNKYLPMQGLPELRDSVSKYLTKNKKNKYKSDNIIIGPGTKELMLLLQIAFDGDILLPIPSWVSYFPQALIGRNKIHWLNTKKENNWFPSAEEIEKAVLKNQMKKYILFLNSPNNPSGNICKNLDEICDVVKKYNIIILSDEIYSELTFDTNCKFISDVYPEKTIISTGLSKWCGAGGWRLGFFVFPDELKEIKNSLKILASESFSSVSAPIQFAAISAYSNDHSNYIDATKNILKSIGLFVYNGLKSNNVLINKPDGGFYLMPEFINNKFKTSSEMCNKILNDTGVAMLPGSEFGFSEDKMLARLSFTDFDGSEFLNNTSGCKNIDEKLIIKFAPNIIEGVHKLKKWSENL